VRTACDVGGEFFVSFLLRIKPTPFKTGKIFMENTMKTFFILVSVMVVLFIAAPNKVMAQKAKTAKIIEGTISEYSCGDNCYLTIIDKKGKKHEGLCVAPLCSKFNETTEMPKKYKGKRVKVTVGKGKRFDGGGNFMDNYDAFIKIQILK
jgi:hypothetical protein